VKGIDLDPAHAGELLEGSRQRIEYGILLDKAVDYLKEHAEIVLVEEQPDLSEEKSSEGQ